MAAGGAQVLAVYALPLNYFRLLIASLIPSPSVADPPEAPDA